MSGEDGGPVLWSEWIVSSLRVSRRRTPILVYNTGTSETFCEGESFADAVSDREISDAIRANPKPRGCANGRGAITVMYLYEGHFGDPIYIARKHHLSCDRWDCSWCSQRKYRKVISQLRSGELFKQAERLVGAGVRYGWKFMTLTAPGESYRSGHTHIEAVVLLRDNFHKLMMAMKKRWGAYHYLCVVEAHRDGWPHLHALLVNNELKPIPKPILTWLLKVWIGKYGMGRVRLTAKVWDKDSRRWVAPRDPWKAIYYATKYMTKSFTNYGLKKAYTCSRDALGPVGDGSGKRGVALWAGYTDDFAVSIDPDSSWGTDTREVFRSGFRDEAEQFKASVEGAFPCRVGGEELERLKKRFPGALLPLRYLRKEKVGDGE
jgi:hypothetical protein